MNIIDRAVAPTPTFFSRLRNIGLIMAAICAALATAPIALPAVVVTAAGYLGVASGVLSAVSQITTADGLQTNNSG